MRYVLALVLLCGCAKSGDNNASPCPGLPSSVVCSQQSGFVDVNMCGQDLHLVNNVAYVCGGCTSLSQTDNSQYTPAASETYNFKVGGPKGTTCSFTVSPTGILSANFN